MHSQPQPIARVVVLALSAGLLLAIFGCVIALTGTAHRSLEQVSVRDADAQTLSEASTRTRFSGVTDPTGTWTAPGRRSHSVAIRDHRWPQDRIAARQAVTVTPVGLDQSFDLRADLMDMAIAIRWHRGPASDLPPGSN